MKAPLTLIFCNAPVSAIPSIQHKSAYITLELLSDGKPHHREEITMKLGEPWRSGLQSLRGDRFGYWLIHSVKSPDSTTTLLQLDPRHLSGDPRKDAAARLERRKQFKQISHREALQGVKREPKAFSELQKAEKDYVLNLGLAANDEGEQGHE